MWMKNRISGLLDDAGPHGQEVIIDLLRTLAKKQGMIVGNRSDFQLSVTRSVVLCDHVCTRTMASIVSSEAVRCSALY